VSLIDSNGDVQKMVVAAHPDDFKPNSLHNATNHDISNVHRIAASNDKIREALQSLEVPKRFGKNPDTPRQRCFQLCGDLHDVRERGASWKAIADTLDQQGLSVQHETLRRYISDAKRVAANFIKDHAQELNDRLAEGEMIDLIVEHIRAQTGIGITEAMLKTLLPSLPRVMKTIPLSSMSSSSIAERIAEGNAFNDAAEHFPD
jgi:hypothetical protein